MNQYTFSAAEDFVDVMKMYTKAVFIGNNTAGTSGQPLCEALESGGFFRTPAAQIIGVFLVTVMVGGGPFGALKYLEYRGAKISGSQGGITEQTYASESGEKGGVLSAYNGHHQGR
jgi:hypothetical protein